MNKDMAWAYVAAANSKTPAGPDRLREAAVQAAIDYCRDSGDDHTSLQMVWSYYCMIAPFEQWHTRLDLSLHNGSFGRVFRVVLARGQ